LEHKKILTESNNRGNGYKLPSLYNPKTRFRNPAARFSTFSFLFAEINVFYLSLTSFKWQSLQQSSRGSSTDISSTSSHPSDSSFFFSTPGTAALLSSQPYI
jgi:hypothetical protein